MSARATGAGVIGSDDLLQVLSTYFQAVYHGDVVALEGIFHPKAMLFGEVKGQPYQKTLAAYLEGVAARNSPAQLGEPFLMRTLFIDVAGPIALAKLNCPMLGFNYVVFLTLVRIDGGWRIVGKTLTHVER
ncbi:nuclear transport factor 2 family protein [Ramlibacter montanisoli]|uniref:nuclear transport factor 2 family protein n=1 Tax=Ramlibacter montanisoli TaxID=2732512 RepID=UPI002814BB0B|nr:nuclear transport factor 2 family protein [Ramlibacter montanisoli]